MTGDEGSAVHLRPATADDAGVLSALALRSKGYWGYGDEFLAACRSELTLEPGDVETRRTIVAADRTGRTVGFATLDGRPPLGNLGMLFVEPDRIGTGVGRVLWREVVRRAGACGFRSIRVEADPGAAPFYERMGATLVGSAPSGSIAGRQLPLFMFELEE